MHHGSKVEPLHLAALIPPPLGMRSCMQSSAGGLLPLLLLLLATEGTSSGEEAARSEESSEVLEHDDFMVRSDAAGHTSTFTGGHDGNMSHPHEPHEHEFMRMAVHHATSLAMSITAS